MTEDFKNQNCTLLCYDAASSGHFLSKFWDNFRSRHRGSIIQNILLDFWPLKMGQIGCPEMSVTKLTLLTTQQPRRVQISPTSRRKRVITQGTNQCGDVTNVSKSVCYWSSDYSFPFSGSFYPSNHGLLQLTSFSFFFAQLEEYINDLVWLR